MFDGLRKEDQIENHRFANDKFWSRSSAKRHAAESCKFFSSITVGVNIENNLDSFTEKEMMPSITIGYGYGLRSISTSVLTCHVQHFWQQQVMK